MQSEIQTLPRASNKLLWTGRILSILTVLFMVFDSVGHLLKPAPVVQAFSQLDFPLRLSLCLGILQLSCLVIYVIPRTAVLGAILLTGYLGGAVAIHMRVGNPVFECIFPIIIGIFFWTGLVLRDPQLRTIFPVRN